MILLGINHHPMFSPCQVDYFISHWWGTPFKNFCESVKRHAIHMSRAAEQRGRNVGKISGDPRRNGDLKWFNQHDSWWFNGASSSNNVCITIWDLENLSLVRKDHHGASGRFTSVNDNNWSKYNWFFRILTWNCLKIGNCQNHAFSCVPDWIAGDLPCYTQFSDRRHSVSGGVSMFSSRGHSEDEGQWNLCQCWLPSGNFT